MKMKNAIKGFTLIELLVVITIIGILATGAVTVYTSQIQKARDTTRLSDVKALQSWIEQVYQDGSEYPFSNTFFSQVSVYVEKLPKDPKHAQPCNDWWITTQAVDCGYSYVVWPDNNWILYWEYEVSTGFENKWNVTKKAAKDWWWTGKEKARFEVWIDTANNNSAITSWWITTAQAGACTLAWAVPTWAAATTTLITINWNPVTAGKECG